MVEDFSQDLEVLGHLQVSELLGVSLSKVSQAIWWEAFLRQLQVS